MSSSIQPQPLYTEIIGSGSYLPQKIVTNQDICAALNTTDEWIQEKIGIQTRHYAAETESVSDLALHAAQAALASAKITANEIDAIVFATSTPEYVAPGSGVILQDKLGCKKIPAFDVRNTSPGFLFSLDVADGLIRSDRYQTVLVVAAETPSKVLDISEKGRMMSVIFGDGAGCFILRATQQKKGFIDFCLHSDGHFFDKLWYPGTNANEDTTKDISHYNFPQMDGRLVFENAVNCMTAVTQEILEKNRLGLNDIDLFLSHQANLRIIKEIVKKLDVTADKAPYNINRVGNTSGASIPILFDQLKDQGKIKPGMTLIMFSFGSGFSWGATLLTV